MHAVARDFVDPCARGRRTSPFRPFRTGRVEGNPPACPLLLSLFPRGTGKTFGRPAPKKGPFDRAHPHLPGDFLGIARGGGQPPPIDTHTPRTLTEKDPGWSVVGFPLFPPPRAQTQKTALMFTTPRQSAGFRFCLGWGSKRGVPANRGGPVRVLFHEAKIRKRERIQSFSLRMWR